MTTHLAGDSPRKVFGMLQAGAFPHRQHREAVRVSAEVGEGTEAAAHKLLRVCRPDAPHGAEQRLGLSLRVLGKVDVSGEEAVLKNLLHLGRALRPCEHRFKCATARTPNPIRLVCT